MVVLGEVVVVLGEVVVVLVEVVFMENFLRHIVNIIDLCGHSCGAVYHWYYTILTHCLVCQLIYTEALQWVCTLWDSLSKASRALP